MYIAETLINPLYSDVAFCRDSEGDESGHYEFWGGHDITASGDVSQNHRAVVGSRQPAGQNWFTSNNIWLHRSKIISKVAGSEINLS